MKEVFKISEFGLHGNIIFKSKVFYSYQEAVEYIKTLPHGLYQVQKMFSIE